MRTAATKPAVQADAWYEDSEHPFFLKKVRQKHREASGFVDNSLNTEHPLTKTRPQSTFITQGAEQIISISSFPCYFLVAVSDLKKPKNQQTLSLENHKYTEENCYL